MSSTVRWPVPGRGGVSAGLARIVTPPTTAGTAHTRNIDDNAAATDALAKAATHPLTEAPATTDALSKAAAHPLTESLTVTDAGGGNNFRLVIDETAQVTDQINTGGSVNHTRNIDDNAAATDTTAKAAAHPLTDTASATDARTKTTGKGLTETPATADAFDRTFQAILALTETPSVTDATDANIPGIRWDLDDPVTRWPVTAGTRWD